MTKPIEFWFDFSSPYGYLATRRAEEIEAETGRPLAWRPYLMGVLFKATGRRPLAGQPMVWEYAKRDVARLARRLKTTITMPDPFPVATIAACRAWYRVRDRNGEERAQRLAMGLFDAYFRDNRDISKPETVVEIAARDGVDADWLNAALNDPQVKQRLRDVVDEASARGIFGSPFFVIDDEPFWGADHIDELIAWGRDGPW